MQLTSQVKFCPNAFRVDMYRGCDFGCKYCFANMEAFNETGTGLTKWREARIKDIRNKFTTAFDTDKESKSVVVELLRNRVPLHCGGMSDPFQGREWDMKLTYELIKLCNEYDYPIIFSTKTDHLPEEYFEILNPKLHAFQISIMGWTDEYIRTWETNTGTAKSRADFVKQLRDRGFWCSVRIQPVIDVAECSMLINYLKDVPSYYSIEHLHVIADSYAAKKALVDHCTNPYDFTQADAVIEFKPEVRLSNMLALRAEANKYGVLVGAADNDLHRYTQSRCCCGIDLIGESFDNYLKYNEVYFATGDANISELFVPKSNCRRHMNIGKGKPEVYVEDMVKNYIRKNPNLIPDTHRESIEKQLFGKSRKRLF
jgi:hypothetical protein